MKSAIITGFVLFLIVKVANRAKEVAIMDEEVAEEVLTSDEYLQRIVELRGERKK